MPEKHTLSRPRGARAGTWPGPVGLFWIFRNAARFPAGRRFKAGTCQKPRAPARLGRTLPLPRCRSPAAASFWSERRGHYRAASLDDCRGVRRNPRAAPFPARSEPSICESGFALCRITRLAAPILAQYVNGLLRRSGRALAGPCSGSAGSAFDRSDGASALVLALTADPGWVAALLAIVAAAPAFATKLNPFRILAAGRLLGFAGVV